VSDGCPDILPFGRANVLDRDTRRFALQRWKDILRNTSERLLPSDLEIASKYHDWQDLSSEIQSKIKDPASTTPVIKHMGRIQPLPSVLAALFRNFSNLLAPFVIKFDLVWGIVYLNLKVCHRIFFWLCEIFVNVRYSFLMRLPTDSNGLPIYFLGSGGSLSFSIDASTFVTKTMKVGLRW
jgi:hypothetical protein